MRIQIKYVSTLLVSAALIVLSGCAPGSGGAGASGGSASLMAMDVNRYPANKLVCNPLAPSTPSPSSQAGLKAKLFYLNSSQPRYEDVESYITAGHASDQSLFFSDLNVPTRLFTLGFANASGNTVKDDTGSLLIEYFGLRFNSYLKLASNQSDGLYQIATLSDDGALMSLQDDSGAVSQLINDDGTHMTRMGCAPHAVSFSRDTRRAMQLDYYQGPRYHIALVTMMRLVNSVDAALDPQCGQEGNDMYFDYDNNSLPKQAYMDLLAKGWVAMTPDNFLIPDDAGFNPCKEGDAPVISNFQATENTGTTIGLSWTTDIPATTQVSYQMATGGDVLLTTADNTLSTSHVVTITGLAHHTYYNLQAISISADYGKGLSSTIQSTTSN